MSAKGLRIDLIVGLTGVGIVPSIRRRVDSGTGMFAEVRAVVVINLKMIVPASCAMDVRPGEIIDALPATVIDVVGSDIGGVNVNMWAATATTVEFILILASSLAEILRLGWEKCDCCPTTAWNCRSLQARTPSYHV